MLRGDHNEVAHLGEVAASLVQAIDNDEPWPAPLPRPAVRLDDSALDMLVRASLYAGSISPKDISPQDPRMRELIAAAYDAAFELWVRELLQAVAEGPTNSIATRLAGDST
jgi:hypothetical protein